MSRFRRWLPLLLLLALLAAGEALGVRDLLSWEVLAARQADLQVLVAAHRAAAAIGYCALYAALVAVSFPGAALLTVAGGLLFGMAIGGILAGVGATTGATLLFLAARGAMAPWLARRAAPWLGRLRPRLHRDGFAYILSLRLIPVVPFWLINLAAALSGVRLWHFVGATAIGIVPTTLVYASVGAGLGDVLTIGGRPDLRVIFSPPILLPLVGLALLSLLPMIWRTWRGRDGGL